MLSDPTGRQILRDRPRITSTTMPMDMLRSLPENSVGREYVSWLDREGVSPDTRSQVDLIYKAPFISAAWRERCNGWGDQC